MIAGVNAYRLWTEHWEHVAHGPSLEEKTEYPYQNIRTKNFPWGDGDKVRKAAEVSSRPRARMVILTRQLSSDSLLEPQGQLPQAER